MNFRSKKLLASAQGKNCTMQSLYCNGNPQTTVWAHSNQQRHGKGTGIKSHDCYGAFLCSTCHALYDGRHLSNLSIAEKQELFDRARDKTLLILFEQKILVVA